MYANFLNYNFTKFGTKWQLGKNNNTDTCIRYTW